MQEITAAQLTPQVAALLPKSGHTYRRCLAVLDGVQSGRIFTDDRHHPTWAAAQELADGTLFLGGALTGELIRDLIALLLPSSDVVIAAAPDDPLLALVPEAEYDQGDIDFDERDPAVDLERLVVVPAGLRLARIDAELLPRCEWGDYLTEMFGGVERALANGLGFCMLDGETVVSECYAGPLVRGTLELGAVTHKDYRQRGLARSVCARTTLECERLGYVTWWNCATRNLGSAAIARSLGYRSEQHYRVLAWFKPETVTDDA